MTLFDFDMHQQKTTRISPRMSVFMQLALQIYADENCLSLSTAARSLIHAGLPENCRSQAKAQIANKERRSRSAASKKRAVRSLAKKTFGTNGQA